MGRPGSPCGEGPGGPWLRGAPSHHLQQEVCALGPLPGPPTRRPELGARCVHVHAGPAVRFRPHLRGSESARTKAAAQDRPRAPRWRRRGLRPRSGPPRAGASAASLAALRFSRRRADGPGPARLGRPEHAPQRFPRPGLSPVSRPALPLLRPPAARPRGSIPVGPQFQVAAQVRQRPKPRRLGSRTPEGMEAGPRPLRPRSLRAPRHGGRRAPRAARALGLYRRSRAPRGGAAERWRPWGLHPEARPPARPAGPHQGKATAGRALGRPAGGRGLGGRRPRRERSVRPVTCGRGTSGRARLRFGAPAAPRAAQGLSGFRSGSPSAKERGRSPSVPASPAAACACGAAPRPRRDAPYRVRLCSALGSAPPGPAP